MLNTKMKERLETKFGKNIEAATYNAPDEEYIGDTVETAADPYLGDQKTKLMREGIPVGHLPNIKEDSDDFSRRTVYYDYPIRQSLNQSFDASGAAANDRINICAYMVSTNGLKPYLRYLLYKYPQSDEPYSDLLTFPFFLFEEGMDIRQECTDRVLEYFDNVASHDSVDVIGFKGGSGGMNVFVKLNEATYGHYNDIQHSKRNTDLWLVLIKEMIDTRSVVNFPIHETVTEFFLNNMEFIFLLDKNNTPYTLPLAAYHGNYYKVISFVAVFGLNKSSVFSSLGPYYYFGTYEKALRYAVWTQDHKPKVVDGDEITVNETGKYEKGGIVRFAIFPGNMKVFLNRPDDPEDDSDLTKNRKADDEWISLTARLRDVDGKWAETHNSAYQGVMLLADGRRNQRGPHWVLRDYDQQVPLTYHYVDTSQFGDDLVKEPTYYKDAMFYID